MYVLTERNYEILYFGVQGHSDTRKTNSNYKYNTHGRQIVHFVNHSLLMRKPTICICKNKDADQLRGYLSAFVFAIRILHFMFFLNPKFQVSRCFLCLYKSVSVRPVRKPQCWFSHEAAHIYK